MKRIGLSRKQLLAILLLVILAVVLLTAKFFRQYDNWSSHLDYFTIPEEQRRIESWMHVSYIERKFDLEVDDFLTDKLSFRNRRNSLDEICTKRKLDCVDLIERLNQAAFSDREVR